MTKRCEFYFDFGSPATYLAHTQMPGLAQRSGAEIVYKPMLLGGVFKLTGNQSPVTVPAKGAYLRSHDLPRFIRRYGVSFTLPKGFPVNTLHLMRGAVAAVEDGCLEVYVDAVFRAMWAEARDMADPEVVGGVLGEAGLDAARFAGRIGDEAVKQKLKAETEAVVGRGAFGAPTFFVGDQMFFGQDRLDFVEEALAD